MWPIFCIFLHKILPMKITGLFFIFLIGFVAARTPANHQANEKVILCFGNSITAGYGIDPEDAYPAVLEDLLIEKNLNYAVVNAGLSGETSAGGLTRINWILRNPVDIFILELGANDGLRGLQLTQTKSNLQSIIDKVLNKYPDTEIVIAGMMVPPNMGHDYSVKFTKMFTDLAEENEALLIPFLLDGVGGIPELNLPDGIHPNEEGHRILAKNVFKTIRDIL